MFSSLWFSLVLIVIIAFLFGDTIIIRLLTLVAKWNSYWRPVLQRPQSGSFMPVEYWTDDPKKVGAIATTLASVPGYYLDANGVFVPTSTPIAEKGLLANTNLVWVGFGKRPWTGKLTYTSWEIDEKGTGTFVPKTRPGPEVFFEHTLGLQIDVLSQEDTVVKMGIVFKVQILDPMKALFISGAWVKNANSAVTQVCKEYAGSRSEAQLRTAQDGTSPFDLPDLIKDLSRTPMDPSGVPIQGGKVGLFESDGVIITLARFEEFSFASTDPDLAKSRLAVAIATNNREAALIDAESIEIAARAEGNAARSRVEGVVNLGDQAVALERERIRADAMRAVGEGGGTVILSTDSGSTPSVIVNPGKP